MKDERKTTEIPSFLKGEDVEDKTMELEVVQQTAEKPSPIMETIERNGIWERGI